MVLSNGVKKRTFKDLRTAILICLSSGQHTINQISYQSRINWKTVELHLTYLVGKGLVTEVFSSEYVRVFELTEKGRDMVRLMGVRLKDTNKIIDESNVNIQNGVK